MSFGKKTEIPVPTEKNVATPKIEENSNTPLLDQLKLDLAEKNKQERANLNPALVEKQFETDMVQVTNFIHEKVIPKTMAFVGLGLSMVFLPRLAPKLYARNLISESKAWKLQSYQKRLNMVGSFSTLFGGFIYFSSMITGTQIEMKDKGWSEEEIRHYSMKVRK